MNASPAPAAAVVRLSGLVPLGAFRVAGPSRPIDPATRAQIPRLWSALIGALPLRHQSPDWATYGVVWRTDREEGGFRYLAGVRVESPEDLPPGFEVREIPAATYAVFRITLDGSALQPQVRRAMAAIWGTLLPASGLRIVDGPDFERIEGSFAPDVPGATIDVHVPVEA